MQERAGAELHAGQAVQAFFLEKAGQVGWAGRCVLASDVRALVIPLIQMHGEFYDKDSHAIQT